MTVVHQRHTENETRESPTFGRVKLTEMNPLQLLFSSTVPRQIMECLRAGAYCVVCYEWSKKGVYRFRALGF